ncbi:N-acetylmuramoyl-L-alanine amidase [Prauserella muralis]|nr:N-acetylmuramoyl-L-alanine amidase [Prauserella muralis]
MRGVLLPLAILLALTGCSGGGGGGASGAASGSAPPTTATTALPTATTTTPKATATTPRANTPTRAANTPVVVLDPGHNGGNAAAPEAINRQVPAGRGRTKACNTTGTSTDSGYPEHAFTFDVAGRVARLLSAQGVRVVLTRDTDDGVGPCVHRRAAIGNEAGADAVVSIHADGAAADAGGFHVAYSAPPLNEAQGAPANRLARALVTSMSAAGFGVSDYLGEGGLSPRDDLAGLNLSRRPAVLVECGNMRNATEAAAMSSPAGRQRYASAIAEGVLAYVDAT